MAATFVIPSIFTAIDKFSAPIKRMSSNVTKFAQKAEVGLARAERGFRKLTPALGSVTRQFLSFASAAAITAGIFATLSFSVNAITAFETGLVGVGKTTGIANEELKQLGRSIVMTSNDLRTISSAKLLELAEVAGQMGITDTNDIVKFSTTLAKLEKAASSIQGEEGGRQIAKLLTITKEGVGNVDRFASSLVALGNTNAALEADILSVAGEVARMTTSYGTNSTAILGMASTLEALGVAPQAAGSAIFETFRKIEQAIGSGGNELDDFAKIMGLAPKQVKAAFGEAPQKAFNLFIKGLSRISSEGGSITKSLTKVGLSGKIIAKAIPPLATNFQLLERNMKLSADEAKKNTAANIEFAVAQKTVTSAMDSITVAWSNLVIKQATAGSSLENIQKVLFFVSDNLGTIVKWILRVVGVFALMKLALVTGRTFLTAYNIVLGISTFLQKGNVFALRKSAIAMNAYKFAAGAVTAAQWLWNTAMTLNPIGLIIIGIVALIALIAVIINKWNTWGAALTLFMGPLGLIITLVQSFRRNWDLIVDAFKTEGIVAGFLKIGATILDAVIMPLQQLFQLMANIPGIGGFAQDIVDNLQDFREGLGVNVTTDESGREIVNPRASIEQARTERFESTQNQNTNITIRDETGRASVESDSNLIPVTLDATFRFFENQ